MVVLSSENAVVLPPFVQSVTSCTFAAVLCMGLAACMGSERPPPESDIVASSLAGEEVDDDSQAEEESPRPPACPANEWRECRHYYRDERGQLNCPLSYQFCRADGKAWLPCGKYETAEDGSPLPPKQ